MTTVAPAIPQVRRPLSTPRMRPWRIVLSWVVIALLAFPLGGLLGWAVGGHVDGVVPALIGGALTGAAVGLAEWWLFLRRDLAMGPVWIPATGIALAVGLSLGSAVVGYETDRGSLATMAAISGAAVGIVQGLLLRKSFSLWWLWMIAMPAMWALAWVVTDAAGIDGSNQFTVFGASGSVVFGVLAGLLFMAGKRTHDPSMR